MVQLFTGLMGYAKLMPEASARRKPGPKPKLATPKAKVNRTTTERESPPATQPRPPPATPPFNGSSGYAVTLDLGEVGAVALVVDVNPVTLSVSDRKALYEIVDAFHDWRASQAPAPGTGQAGDDKDEV